MPFFIIVIGASAGGRDALSKLIATLPQDLDAAVFIVMHLGKPGIENYLANQLQKYSVLPCQVATDGLAIQKGHIYIAAIDQHLVVKPGTMVLTKGPAENRWRPSIDVLFRSAAVAYSERVIGIVLTGLLDDGTAGMQAIKRCGGTSMVQDPQEAMYPDMPQSVLENTMVDFVLPVAAMSEAIQQTIATKQIDHIAVPPELKAEVALVEKTVTEIAEIQNLGEQTVYTCPDCGGSLWELKDGDHTRYRCHVGHAYSQKDLLHEQVHSINASLWTALRLMEQRRNLLNKMSKEEAEKGLHSLVKMHTERVRELEVHISNLKELIFHVKPD
jgi:two-component system, chemotaxis family, protein-glutamate methylesterase/glutaminase